ncbi:MAG: hypothetical protein HFH02_00015 [Dorea sp.]|nr:hypothetical protein [Dorea sp.]
MFGKFRMSYGAQPLTGGKARDTHFTSLMQLLLHHVPDGISRDRLEETLLGDRDIENRHQALQTIVYKAKKKLRSMGLPEQNYIILEKGVYRWTPFIAVREDAAVFDELCKKAADAREEEERLRLYLEACRIYKGEFLSDYAGVLWAGAEARKYHSRFCDCVQQAAFIIRKRQDWFRLEDLGRYAAKIDPFSDWEGLILEALIGSERYKEAQQLYADTADIYLKERGLYPASKITKLMDFLEERMNYPYNTLAQIQEFLREDAEEITGGYLCSYPVFRGAYQIFCRMMERGGQSGYLMLCTLVDGKGNPMEEGQRFKELSERLGLAIQSSVRHGDIVSQYGKGQFLVMLINITRENCELIEKRISQKFLTGRQRIGVQYHVDCIICEA